MAKKKSNGQLEMKIGSTKQSRKARARHLGSVLKSARKVMRKDKGTSSDVERTPMLTWIMFLKFLDDMERQRELETEMSGEDFRPIIQPPYRWRDWAAHDDGITGPELLAFVNQDEATLPDGEKGKGLIKYLRELEAGADDTRKRVVSEIFSGVVNRMINGYLLRDVINLVDELHFDSSEEVHILSEFYETMLRELRDAAGNNGEFYTPRPVVEFVVQMMDPRLGEEVEDPACGTGGFLVEAFSHLEKQCETVEDRETLQHHTLHGGEAKPLPYMLGQMNLLLHGLEAPDIHYGNSLKVRLQEMGDRDRVDVIVTNPPFGGEEEPGIQNGFPKDKQTAETALLFLQLIMRKLRRPGHGSERGGRAAVIVPDGTLSTDGVAARIKKSILQGFDLHTIVRLPKGVFEPYTDIQTNILFFDRNAATETIWYYQVPLPEGRKNYTKTKPMRSEEFEPVAAWWNDREPNEHAWKIDFKAQREKALEKAELHWEKAEQADARARELEQTIQAAKKEGEPDTLDWMEEQLEKQNSITKEEQTNGDAIYWAIYNLDHRHPDSGDAVEHRSPEEIAESVLKKEQRIVELMQEIRAALGEEVMA